ncbi:hypothetical protein EDB81DRAFT_788961 [Dactylonectria macrodidyma]|uniref:Uncharacterized protein n=1 Tax=Dactylonectria macrodidyma TaxID=307937 RepID=A0A9P9J999_9HYPO|nr:hypothetical protein EDB81DRAFT_788961 [Dactylonectria macrodidyma]
MSFSLQCFGGLATVICFPPLFFNVHYTHLAAHVGSPQNCIWFRLSQTIQFEPELGYWICYNIDLLLGFRQSVVLWPPSGCAPSRSPNSFFNAVRALRNWVRTLHPGKRVSDT